MIQEITQYVIGGFIGWILHGSISFYISRNNIRRYLVITIQTYIKFSKDNYKILNDYFDKVQVGSKVKVSPRYTANGLEDFNSVKSQSITFLTESEIIKLTKFCAVLQDVENFSEGFCLHLKEYEKNDKQIDDEIYKHLKIHLHKLNKLLEQMPNGIKKLSQLEDEYDIDFKI